MIRKVFLFLALLFYMVGAQQPHWRAFFEFEFYVDVAGQDTVMINIPIQRAIRQWQYPELSCWMWARNSTADSANADCYLMSSPFLDIDESTQLSMSRALVDSTYVLVVDSLMSAQCKDKLPHYNIKSTARPLSEWLRAYVFGLANNGDSTKVWGVITIQ